MRSGQGELLGREDVVMVMRPAEGSRGLAEPHRLSCAVVPVGLHSTAYFVQLGQWSVLP